MWKHSGVYHISRQVWYKNILLATPYRCTVMVVQNNNKEKVFPISISSQPEYYGILGTNLTKAER